MLVFQVEQAQLSFSIISLLIILSHLLILHSHKPGTTNFINIADYLLSVCIPIVMGNGNNFQHLEVVFCCVSRPWECLSVLKKGAQLCIQMMTKHFDVRPRTAFSNLGI